MVDIALLGTGGMMPMPERFLSSMMMRLNGKLILTDCGEGTQVSLKILGWGFKAIDVICFTHYHADHISGLPGMLLAIGNSGRTEPVKLMGPTGLKRVVDGLRLIFPELPFKLEYIEIDDCSKKYEFDDIIISTCEGDHRIKCLGYRFDIPRKGKFSVEKAQALGLPVKAWSILQKGGEFEMDGKIYTGDMVLGEPRKGISIAFSTDTRPVNALIDLAKNTDLFICEGMYGDDEKRSKALEYHHMLFSEAAKLARAAGTKELWLTHLSPSMSEPEQYIDNTRKIFANTVVGLDRMTKRIDFEE